MKINKVMLLHPTGYELADSLLQEVITRFEAAFPEHIVGYYVEGSYADQSAITTSDLDLLIVFRMPPATESERAIVEQLLVELEESSSIELDIEVTDVGHLQQSASPMFKLGSRLIYGEDIRDATPLIPIAEWARQRMHAAYWLMINVFDRPHPVRRPLDFPKPQAQFYGYANRTMRLAGGQEIPTMRNLIRVSGWIATARIAYEAEAYVVRKRECVPTYRQVINDEWTPLLIQIDQRCRTDWHYHIPTTTSEQQELHTILKQTLQFENHFLGVYQQFLLAQLTGEDHHAQQEALNFLNHTCFDDAEIIQAVRQLET